MLSLLTANFSITNTSICRDGPLSIFLPHTPVTGPPDSKVVNSSFQIFMYVSLIFSMYICWQMGANLGLICQSPRNISRELMQFPSFLPSNNLQLLSYTSLAQFLLWINMVRLLLTYFGPGLLISMGTQMFLNGKMDTEKTFMQALDQSWWILELQEHDLERMAPGSRWKHILRPRD